MKMVKKLSVIKIISVILVIALIAVIFILIQQPTTKESIKVGFISPLTGPPAVIGVQQKNSVGIATEEINSQGGINGRPLEIIYEDSKCNGKEAVLAVNKLINVDGVKIVLGGICSAETLSAKSVFESNHVIDFSWGSSPDITKDSQYIFRNSPSDSEAGWQLADYIYEKGYTKIGILSVNADFSNAFTNELKNGFVKQGGKVIAEEVVMPDVMDFRTPISKIKAKNPETIFVLHADPSNTGNMVKQIREQMPDIQLFSAYAFSSPAAIEAAGSKNAEGIIYIDSPALDNSNPKSMNFISKYEIKYGERPLGSEFYAAAAYDSAYIIADAVKECDTNTNCIRDHLINLEYDGTLGKYSFSESGDVIGINYVIKIVE